jgi:phosphoribosylformylglycinamidine cyclo-ligase
VDVDLERECSKIFYEAAKRTWENRRGKIGEVTALFDDFAGLRCSDISNLSSARVHSHPDSAGTKPELAERLSTYTGDFSYHKLVAFGLIASVVDDASIKGAEPAHITDVLKVNRLCIPLVKYLAEGLVEASAKASVAVVDGEIAQQGNRVGGYGKFCYDWSANVVWFAREERMISGYEVKPGNPIVSFEERGFRDNGLSLFRKIMNRKFGNKWHQVIFRGKSIAEVALTPSTIYTPTLVEITGGFDGSPQAKIKAAAHISGGGIPEKLGRVLKASGHGALLYDLFSPSELMLYCQELGDVSDKEACNTWNMGNGMLLVTEEPHKIIRIASKHGIEAKIAGEIIKEHGITIRNQALKSRSEPWLNFT